MKLRFLTAGALAVCVLGAWSPARADGEAPAPIHHRSTDAYASGIVLVTVGSVLLTFGTVWGVGAIYAVTANSTTGEGAGIVGAAAFGSLIAVGASLAGFAMLAPGIVLVVKNQPIKRHALPSPVTPPPRDAHAEPPAPPFVAFPLVAGRF